MARNQMRATLLRPVLALLAIAGLLTLGGCGGGSGAPNNPFAPGPVTPGPLFVLPPSMTVYTDTPATLTISGGAPPYQAFSSNGTALPVTQAVNGSTVVLLPSNVAANTTAVITIQDNIGQTATSTITVSPAPIFNTLTITPARTTCGTNAVCSGDTATAAVQVTGPGGAGIPNRQVRFDVVTGAYGIQTNNPAQPLVPTLTVVSDTNGNARVVLQATVNAPTQSAQLAGDGGHDRQHGDRGVHDRPADRRLGDSFGGARRRRRSPAPTRPRVLRGSASTTSFTAVRRLTTLSSTFPTAVTLLNSAVTVSGGFFEAITNGTCVNPLTFTIVDATGRQTTATLINQPGTAAPPTPPTPPTPAALAITPANDGCRVHARATDFAFAITGGTPPYNFSAYTRSSDTDYNPTNQQRSSNRRRSFTVSGLDSPARDNVSVRCRLRRDATSRR